MRRFCWRERSEKLNWRLLGALDMAELVRRGDPTALEPYALHVTFARLPAGRDPTTRDAWFLVRLLQLAMEYMLFVRARDGEVLESLSEELRIAESERDEVTASMHKWKTRSRSGEKQVEKLHQVLQNIAKLLQIHGASPSAVATIETLLTELISERRARQRKKRSVEKENDSGNERDDVLAVQEARVCGFCGKIFSSAEYLDKHLVRRHPGESIEREAPIKCKVKSSTGYQEAVVAGIKDEGSTASELAMQRMVQQVEQALHTHEENLRSLAKEESRKVQQVYEQLHTETQLVEELKAKRLKTEQELDDSRRELEEAHQQKHQAEEELSDLKEQIQFITMKKKMMGHVPSAVMPAASWARSDELSATEAEVKSLQQTLEMVNTELEASRGELAKLQGVHLAVLREKKELTDKLAGLSHSSAATQLEIYTQTEAPVMINETTQTDEEFDSLIIQDIKIKEYQSPTCEDVGTDPMVTHCEDVGMQTVVVSPPSYADVEVQTILLNEPAPIPTAVIEPVLEEPVPADLPSIADVINVAVPPEPTDEGRIPDYIQQIHIEDLLDALTDRAQSAAAKVTPSETSSNNAPKTCSSIPRHKFVRSHFQHDESAVKERVASCLQQLDQFSSRFGVPAKSVWLADENLNLVQQALHGHLEVLPSEVLAKMIDCENAVNTIIETEWAPMEKTRQQALERFKMETHAKSEASQGLVRQAMAAFGVAMHPEQSSGIVNDGDRRAESDLNETLGSTRISVTSDSVPVRRYSAKNQLTVVIEGEVMTEGIAYVANENMTAPNDANNDFGLANTERDTNDAVEGIFKHGMPMESGYRDVVEPIISDLDLTPVASNSRAGQSTAVFIEKSGREELDAIDIAHGVGQVVPVAHVLMDRLEEGAIERPEFFSPDTRIVPDQDFKDNSRSSWGTCDLERPNKAVFSTFSSTPVEVGDVVSRQAFIEDSESNDWEQDKQQDERSRWQLPRIRSFTDVESRQAMLPAITRLTIDDTEEADEPHPTNSLELDRLLPVSQVASAEPITGLEHTLSLAASSEMSFDANIPSLGTESAAVDEPTSTASQGTGQVVEGEVQYSTQESIAADEQIDPTPIHNDSMHTNAVVKISNVMSFDESDIEEVMLT